jgi:Phytanoyl-CoA dioxygenase (PhyH)
MSRPSPVERPPGPCEGMDPDEIDYLLRTRGWVRFPERIDGGRAVMLADDLDRLYAHCRSIQVRNGVADNMAGAAHHLVGYGTSLDALLDDFPLHREIEAYFDGKYVIGTFGAALNPPGSTSYVAKPHRDIRAFTGGYRMSLNMLVMLDDFTEENGATLLLDGSHHVEALPEREVFYRHARPALGRRGDVLLFDSLLVHAAAANRTDRQRRALTLTLTRPWMKGQIDFPRYLSGEAQAGLSPLARQLLGFNAQVADSLDAYYQPPERWAFKADQR